MQHFDIHLYYFTGEITIIHSHYNWPKDLDEGSLLFSAWAAAPDPG